MDRFVFAAVVIAAMITIGAVAPAVGCQNQPGSAQIQPRVYINVNPQGSPVAEDPKDTHLFKYIVEYRITRTRISNGVVVSDTGWILQPGVTEVRAQDTTVVYLNMGSPYSQTVTSGGVKYTEELSYRVSDYQLDDGYALIDPPNPPGALILKKGGGVPHNFKYLRNDVPTVPMEPTPEPTPVRAYCEIMNIPCIRIT
jgi:hypothetical protein